MGVSESVQTIALRAQTSAFAVRDFRPDRNHMRDKALVARESRFAAAEIGLSVSVTAPHFQPDRHLQALGRAARR